jgi:ribonuclease VapC
MVIDTSALLAILQGEQSHDRLIAAIDAAPTRAMSVATFVECSIVVSSRYGAEGLRDLDHFIVKAEIALVPVDAEQAYLARQAWRQYGKGQHAAGLNFGDCFAYALAVTLGEPLLCIGDDLVRTDADCVAEFCRMP